MATQLDAALEERLARLAAKTGITYPTREVIEQHLEDYYLSLEASKDSGRLYSAGEAKRELGLRGQRKIAQAASQDRGGTGTPDLCISRFMLRQHSRLHTSGSRANSLNFGATKSITSD